MKYCNILLSALATLMTLTGIMPCGACAADAVRAASLGHNQAVAHRVYEEGFNLGRFEVPCSPGSSATAVRRRLPTPTAWPKSKAFAKRFMADGRIAEEWLCATRTG